MIGPALRSPPAWLQWVALGLFAIYHGACTIESLRLDDGALKRTFGNVFWLAHWEMFTKLATGDGDRVIEGWNGTEWQRIPLEDTLPARWDGGYRYQRSTLDRDARVRDPFMVAACQASQAQKVRYVHRNWRVKPGRFRPPTKVTSKVLAEFDCGKKGYRPSGRVL